MTNGSKDRMPTEEELDALQAQIEDVLRKTPDSEKESENEVEADGKSEPADQAETMAAVGNADEAVSPDAGPVLVARIAELEAEIEAMKDKALRAMADADNVKKRAEREVAASKIYAVERFAVDMLSVSDNLGRALQSLGDADRDAMGENAKNLLSGIELTEKELIAVFSRHGIKPVPGTGSKFDPNFHQAVAQIPSEEAKGDVANVMQTGFTLGERTLRAAMVAVSTGPAKA